MPRDGRTTTSHENARDGGGATAALRARVLNSRTGGFGRIARRAARRTCHQGEDAHVDGARCCCERSALHCPSTRAGGASRGPLRSRAITASTTTRGACTDTTSALSSPLRPPLRDGCGGDDRRGDRSLRPDARRRRHAPSNGHQCPRRPHDVDPAPAEEAHPALSHLRRRRQWLRRARRLRRRDQQLRRDPRVGRVVRVVGYGSHARHRCLLCHAVRCASRLPSGAVCALHWSSPETLRVLRQTGVDATMHAHAVPDGGEVATVALPSIGQGATFSASRSGATSRGVGATPCPTASTRGSCGARRATPDEAVIARHDSTERRVCEVARFTPSGVRPHRLTLTASRCGTRAIARWHSDDVSPGWRFRRVAHIAL